MKKLFLLAVTVFVSAMLHAQGGVYLFIQNVTNGAGTGSIHSNETKLTSVQNGFKIDVTRTTGTAIGKPQLSDIVFTKDFDLASLRLQSRLLNGQFISSAEIRYYDGTDVLRYVVKLDNCFVGSATSVNDGSGCTNGCQSLYETYTLIAPSKLTTINYANGPGTPTQTLTWDILTNTTTIQ